MMLPFTPVDPRLGFGAALIGPFHDGFSALMMTGELVFVKGNQANFFNNWLARVPFVVMLAAVLGGPMGKRSSSLCGRCD